MITITIQDDQVRAELRRIQAKLGDLAPAMAGAMALEGRRLGQGMNLNISAADRWGSFLTPTYGLEGRRLDALR
jgi:hypothetical protein